MKRAATLPASPTPKNLELLARKRLKGSIKASDELRRETKEEKEEKDDEKEGGSMIITGARRPPAYRVVIPIRRKSAASLLSPKGKTQVKEVANLEKRLEGVSIEERPVEVPKETRKKKGARATGGVPKPEKLSKRLRTPKKLESAVGLQISEFLPLETPWTPLSKSAASADVTPTRLPISEEQWRLSLECQDPACPIVHDDWTYCLQGRGRSTIVDDGKSASSSSSSSFSPPPVVSTAFAPLRRVASDSVSYVQKKGVKIGAPREKKGENRVSLAEVAPDTLVVRRLYRTTSIPAALNRQVWERHGYELQDVLTEIEVSSPFALQQCAVAERLSLAKQAVTPSFSGVDKFVYGAGQSVSLHLKNRYRQTYTGPGLAPEFRQSVLSRSIMHRIPLRTARAMRLVIEQGIDRSPNVPRCPKESGCEARTKGECVADCPVAGGRVFPFPWRDLKGKVCLYLPRAVENDLYIYAQRVISDADFLRTRGRPICRTTRPQRIRLHDAIYCLLTESCYFVGVGE